MVTLWGADVEQLRTLATAVRQRSQTLSAARDQVDSAIEQAAWFGHDSEEFRAEWTGSHRVNLSAAIDDLIRIGETLDQNADDQEETSDGGVAPAGPVGSGGGQSGDGGQVPTGAPTTPQPYTLTPAEYGDLSEAERQEWLATATDEEIEALYESMKEQGLYPGPDAGPVANEYWTRQAAQDAGIDYLSWDPSQGTDANRENIEAVYEYYAQLYQDNPDLQWAGMAAMIGPSFAAGFMDLAMFRDIAQGVEVGGQVLDYANVPGAELLQQVGEFTDEDLRFYETTFLGMQQEIFHDQASMHAAYEAGGMQEIEAMYESGAIDEATYDAWADIDSGDPERISEGNTEMLRREQQDIIHDDYQAMTDRPVTGEAMTYMMTMVGEASIPGTQTFAEVNPLTMTVETPGPDNVPFTPFDNPLQGEVQIGTPLADGNIANTEQRWEYIQADTLPAYQDLLANDPGRVDEILGTPVSERIEDYRLTDPDRLGRIMDRLASDWTVDVDQ